MNNTYTTRAFGIIASFAIMFGVFAIPAPKQAFAWTCALTVDKASITEGESVKLGWDYSYPDKFSIDNGVGNITVDNSFRMVSPTETTTYTGTVTDSKNRTAYCSVKVVVKKVPAPVCTMDANKTTIEEGESVNLSWTSDNATSASLDQGIGNVSLSGNKSVSPTETTTYTGTFKNDKGDKVTCAKKITVKKPVVPVCTLAPIQGRVIVDLKKTDGTYDKLSTSNPLISKNVSIPAGTYTITAESFDAYSGRKDVASGQNHEQWNLELYNGTTLQNSFGPTSDLQDGVDEARNTSLMATAGVAGDPITKIMLPHAYPTASGSQDVYPICIAFDKVTPEPEAPVCTLTSDKDKVTVAGENVKLTWTSDKAVSGSMDQGIGSISLDGDKDVSISATKTFTATFKNSKGKKVTCSKTITYEPPVVGPACTLSVSPSSVTQGKGESVTLTWTSQNHTAGSIDQGIGAVQTSGSTTFIPNSETLFTGTFTGPHGTSTCTARVTVIIPQCTTCGGGGSNQPRVELTKRDLPNNAPLAFVYLSQVPYTGFPATPLETALYWFALVVISGVVAYFIVIKNVLGRFAGALFSGNAGRSQELEEVPHFSATRDDFIHAHYAKQERESYAERTMAAAPLNLPTEDFYQMTPVAATPVPASPRLADSIEERAHAEQVLLSPDAIAMLISSGEGKDSLAMAALEAILPKAKITFAREDGWILVNKERMEILVGKPAAAAAATTISPAPARINAPLPTTNPHVEAIAARYAAVAPEAAAPVAAPAPVAVATTPAPVTESVDVSVPAFITFLAEGNQEAAFRMLRTLSQQGAVHAFMMQTIAALDSVHQHRIQGGVRPDAKVAEKVAMLSNTDLEVLLGIMTGGIDFSYTSTETASKVTVAKAMDFFAAKRA